MTDIMEDWKNARFIIVPNEYEEPFEHLVVLSDISFWLENLEDLIAWCDLNDCEVVGMTVNVPDGPRAMLFTLRWS